MKLIHLSIFLSTAAFAHPDFKLGVENIPDSFIGSLKSNGPLTIGLITNQTGKDQQGKTTAAILAEKGIIIKYLFAPEHGLDGKQKAASTIADGHDKNMQIPVVSLYKNGSGTSIRDLCMSQVDALFFDIQDSGMRHYTYISTLFYAIECAALHNKTIVVLDRPNPLGCIMEGPLVESPLKSFIAIAEIPLRHGMTVGELAYFFNTYAVKKKANLYIIPMKNYERTHGIGTTLATALSPNITSIDCCYGYSFLGLLGEVKPFNVGIGTPQAFQLITLPETLKLPADFWSTLSAQLAAYGINSSSIRVRHPKKKSFYQGICIHITDINKVDSFPALLAVLETCKAAGVKLQFSQGFDKACGTAKVREYIMGTVSKQELQHIVNTHMQSFLLRALNTFRYQPHPLIKAL